MSLTLVTGFIDLERREPRPPGKFLVDYARHARWLLEAEAPLVVFAESHVLPQLRPLRRSGMPTCWMPIEFESLRWHSALDQIETARREPASLWLDPLKDTPAYLAVTYEKTEWLRRAVNANPFSTASFAWLDLGLAHLATHARRTTLAELDAGLADLLAMTARPGMLRVCAIEAVAAEAAAATVRYYAEPRWPVAGGMLAGTSSDLAWFADTVGLEIGRCLELGIATTEEMIWGAILHRHPERFFCHFGDHGSCLVNVARARADIGIILGCAWRAIERDCIESAGARLDFVTPAAEPADAAMRACRQALESCAVLKRDARRAAG